MALIVDANMPKGCCWKLESGCFDICNLRKVCGRGVSDRPLMTGYRHRDCPIIGEIPDNHGRLIDVDGLMKKVREEADFPSYEWSKAIECLEEAPTIVEATNE